MPLRIERRTTEKATLTPSRHNSEQSDEPVNLTRNNRGRLGLGDAGPGAFAISRGPLRNSNRSNVVQASWRAAVPTTRSFDHESTSPTAAESDTEAAWNGSSGEGEDSMGFRDEMTMTAQVTVANDDRKRRRQQVGWCAFAPLMTAVIIALTVVFSQRYSRKASRGGGKDGSTYVRCSDLDTSIDFSDVEYYDILVAELGVDPPPPASSCAPVHEALLFVAQEYNKLTEQSRLNRFVLATLFESTDGPNWMNSTGWMTTQNECDGWYGIGCDSNGQVTVIGITHNAMAGTLPDEIGRLTSLQELFIAGNKRLAGSIPLSIQNLMSLARLDVRENSLSGAPLSFLARMTSLEGLCLWKNQFSGTIPTEIGKMTLLNTLMISSNNFLGEIPKSLGVLSTLTTLHLGGSHHHGTIPASLYELTDLEALWFEPSHLSGTISTELVKLTNLKQLLMQANGITGTIPSEIGQMTNLERLDFRGVSGLTGIVPTDLTQLVNLTALYLDGTQVSGTLPFLLCTIIEESTDNIWAPCTLQCEESCCRRKGCNENEEGKRNVFMGGS